MVKISKDRSIRRFCENQSLKHVMKTLGTDLIFTYPCFVAIKGNAKMSIDIGESIGNSAAGSHQHAAGAGNTHSLPALAFHRIMYGAIL